MQKWLLEIELLGLFSLVLKLLEMWAFLHSKTSLVTTWPI
jgi:hypothetical protein